MINKLIKMEVPHISVKTKELPKGVYSPKDYATAFINGMGAVQRERFKKMLTNGIKCGMSVAENYGIEYEPFIIEVKKQLEV